MRWDELTVDEQSRRSLPGFGDPATIRTFDAPEAMDIRFYEVRAKSALNRVPERSRMPFRWTINPYRGCTHACLYCLWGRTRILMADGRTKRLEDVAVGDEIYGTVRTNRYRRYVRTKVLDTWRSFKPAYRVTLEDETDLIASADHRFLTALVCVLAHSLQKPIGFLLGVGANLDLARLLVVGDPGGEMRAPFIIDANLNAIFGESLLER